MLLEHLALAPIQGRQACESFVQPGEHIDEVALLNPQRLIELDGVAPASPFGGLPGARIVDQQLAHHPRGDGEEVRTVSKSGLPRVNELEIRLVDERRGVQASIGSLSPPRICREHET